MTTGGARTPVVRRLTTYPVKSLDGCTRDAVDIVANGGLDGDREFALFDGDGAYVNGKRERAVHRVRSEFDPETRRLRLSLPDGSAQSFDVDDDTDRAELTAFLSAFFGYDVSLGQNREGGFPDDPDASGPTVISTATIREVASWYPDIDEDGVRRRLRANVELGTPPGEETDLDPFWEDRLFDRRDTRVAFEIGDVRFSGVNPCQRCVVPSRDPDTGEEYDGFRETFVQQRRETMPAWSGGEWFDHDFRLMVNTTVEAASWGETLSVGDEVRVLDVRQVAD
jgi:uncharacterized protein YcbX